MSKKECHKDQWIIVTGAAGFIGSCIIRELNDRGYDKNIIAVDDFKMGHKWKNLVGKRYNEFLSRYELFDFLDREEENVEAIIHMGANSATTGTNGCEYYQLNYRYTIELAKRAMKRKIRFIYASSAATYGRGENGFRDDISGLEKLHPLNLYGYSKHMFDLWALSNDCYKDIVGLKFFNVYGPNEYHKGRMASMVYHMYNQVLEKGKISLFKSNAAEFSDGEQKRDFIYVKDTARMTVDFLLNDLTGIYNIGSGAAKSWNDVAYAVFKALGKETKIEYIPMPEDIAKTYQNYTLADVTSLTKEGIKVDFDLESGVFDYITKYLKTGATW